MKQTENLKMNLPEETDVVDIEQLNDNFRKIDAELPTKADLINGKVNPEQLPSERMTNADYAALVILQGKLSKKL